VGIFRKTCIRCFVSGGGMVPSETAHKHLPVQLVEFRLSASHPGAVLERRRKTRQSGNSRICARMVMTDNKRAQVAIPHQDRRNLSCLAWFSSPRGTTCNTNFRREMKQIRRISHGSARSVESLRRMRLPLVPCPDTRECVLQRVSVKVEDVSNPGESQAARPSGR
jgi:hypothetical protein